MENDSANICQTFLNNNLVEYCKLDIDKLCKKKNLDIQDIITGITIGPNTKTSVEILKKELLKIYS